MGRKPIPRPHQRLCSRCHEKWSQAATGLCRRCARELGDERTTREIERDKLAAQPQPRRMPEPEIPPFEEITVRGECFEVRRNGAIQKVLSDGRAWEDPDAPAPQ